MSPSFTSQRPDSTLEKAGMARKTEKRRKHETLTQERQSRQNRKERKCTFHQFSFLFGELLVLVRSEQAVAPQATCVRQTLDNCI